MIGIVFGGESCEHDISVITALSVNNAIKNDFETILVYLKNDGFYVGKELSDINTFKDFNHSKFKSAFFANGALYIKKAVGYKRLELDCVLMCNHGGKGEDGSLSGYFETTGIPYTASGVFGSSVCMDKVYTKLLLEKLKFPTVSYDIYRVGFKTDKFENSEYPLIIKPARLGSSVGIAYVNDFAELKKGIEFALQFDDKLLIEKALVNFREFNCAAVNGENGISVSDVEEVSFSDKYLNFDDKYMNSCGTGRKIPAQISDKLTEKIRRMTREIYLLLELKGIVRIDYMFSEGKLYVNEINTIPGSLAGYMFTNRGMAIVDLVKESVYIAQKEFKQKRNLTRDFSSDVLRHFDGTKSGGIKK